MFITIEQIKAARALLDWTQEDLANRAGINIGQVRNYEAARAKPQAVLEAIYKALLNAGIEFMTDGARKRTPEMRILRGQQGFWDFYDDVYETVRAHGGKILINNGDVGLFWKWLGEKRHSHKERMDALKNFEQKIIFREGSDGARGSYETTTYRLLPAEQFSGVPFYVYGKKLAIIVFKPNDVDIFILDEASIAEAYEKTFYAQWDKCRPPGGDAEAV